MDPEKAIQILQEGTEKKKKNPGLTGIAFVESQYSDDGQETVGPHLSFSFHRKPGKTEAELIVINLTRKLNEMDSGTNYTFLDDSREVSGMDFVSYRVLAKHPKHSQLDEAHFKVTINTNPSLGESIDIYPVRSGLQREDLVLKLRIYQATLNLE